tara:strand:- start:1224 stop:1430 length:207 start_codon:yes stop_codon:yes gene_type:complete
MMKGSMIYTKGLEDQIQNLRTELLKIKENRKESELEMYKKAYWVLKVYVEDSKKDLPEYIKEMLELEL